MTKWTIVAAVAALAACAPVMQVSSPSNPSIRRVSLADACTGQPGYADFRRALSAAVARRDPAALEALFDPGGYMRVHSISRYTGPDNESWQRPEVAQVWDELDALLRLGCAPDGAKLYLPPAGALAEHGTAEGYYALVATAIRARPDASAPVVRALVPGELVAEVQYNQPEGWHQVQLGTATGYVPAANMRSVNDFMLVLVRDGEGWKIREFFGGA